jgi:hypothetical protein
MEKMEKQGQRRIFATLSPDGKDSYLKVKSYFQNKNMVILSDSYVLELLLKDYVNIICPTITNEKTLR